MEILDILILGSGPAALCLASVLANQDLNIKGISTKSPNEKWENTYGIWASELEELGLESLLSHRWRKTVSFFGDGENKKGDNPTKHNYDYGLINQEAFQNELLKKCKGIYKFNNLDFVIGSDLIKDIFYWKNFDKIILEVSFFIILREGYPVESNTLEMLETYKVKFKISTIITPNISSSKFRLNFNCSNLPSSLIDIVKRNNLYDSIKLAE